MRSLLDSEQLYKTPETMAGIDPTRLVERFSYAGRRDGRILITPTATRYFDGGVVPVVFTGRNADRGVLPLLQDRLVIRSDGLGDTAELVVVDQQATAETPGILRKYDITGLGTIDEEVRSAWEYELGHNQSMVLSVESPVGWVKVIDPGYVLEPHERVEELVLSQLDGEQAAEFAHASKVVWAVMSYHNQQRGAAT